MIGELPVPLRLATDADPYQAYDPSSSKWSRGKKTFMLAVLAVVAYVCLMYGSLGPPVLGVKRSQKHHVRVFGNSGVKFTDVLDRKFGPPGPLNLAASFDVIERDGPRPNDIQQGELANCYFLAAIAAIAKMHPEIIEHMFVRRDLWENTYPVYSTKWLLGGKDTEVAVDAMVPALYDDSMAFEGWNDGRDAWPVILEKAWAKISGSYKNAEWGIAAEPLKAITQAPMQMYAHDDTSRSELWAKLSEAALKGYPMVGGTRASFNVHPTIGVHGRHAYSVLDAHESVGGQSWVLEIYNPWAMNDYRGVLRSVPSPDGQEGKFFMTIDEYREAFQSTYIAEVQTGYVVSEVPLFSDDIGFQHNVFETTVDFTMKSNEPFSVQIEWPTPREVGASCSVSSMNWFLPAPLRVSKDGVQMATGEIHWDSTSIRADLPGGSGTYTVQTELILKDNPWLPTVELSVYGPERVNLASKALAKAVSNGASLVVPAVARKFLAQPVVLEAVSDSLCQVRLQRLNTLGNAEEIARDRIDRVFPPRMSSIAFPGTTCGDAAHGISNGCERYNHWKSFADVADRQANIAHIMQKCLSVRVQNGKCIIGRSNFNGVCNQDVMFTCHQYGCGIRQVFEVGYEYTASEECCTCYNHLDWTPSDAGSHISSPSVILMILFLCWFVQLTPF